MDQRMRTYSKNLMNTICLSNLILNIYEKVLSNGFYINAAKAYIPGKSERWGILIIGKASVVDINPAQ